MGFEKTIFLVCILQTFLIVTYAMKTNFYIRVDELSLTGITHQGEAPTSGVLQCTSYACFQDSNELFIECSFNFSLSGDNWSWQQERNLVQLPCSHQAVNGSERDKENQGDTEYLERSVLFSSCSSSGCLLLKYKNNNLTRLPINDIRNLLAMTYVFSSKMLFLATGKPYRIYRYDGRSMILLRNRTKCSGFDTDQQANLIFISEKDRKLNTHDISRMDAEGKNFTYIFSGRHPIVSFTLNPSEKLIYAAKFRTIFQITYTGTNFTHLMNVYKPVICYNILLNTLFMNDRKVMYKITNGEMTKMFKYKHYVKRMINFGESILVTLIGSRYTFSVHNDSYELFLDNLSSSEVTLYE